MIKNMFKHFCLINRHKWEVFKLSIKLGIPVRGILHDLSKFSWTEFMESAKYYNGGRSPITICKKEEGYSKAWLHHKGRNKHHAEYWVDEKAPNPTPMIPYKYLCEMVCDQVAAGRVYQGKQWVKEYQLSYWNKNKDKFRANEKIKTFLTEVYEQLAEKGIAKTITKKNIREVYNRICM